jgi:hypothetical protein
MEEEEIEEVTDEILFPSKYRSDERDQTRELELTFGFDFEEYRERVSRFATARERNYNGFRDFLDGNSEIYTIPNICNLSNKDIDSIFEAILKDEGEAILEKLGEA